MTHADRPQNRAASARHRTASYGPAWHTTALHVAGLWALAVAQPLFDLLARQPEALVAHGLRGGRLVLFAAVVALAVPLVAGLVLATLHRLAPALGRLVGGTLVAGLAATLALQLLNRLNGLTDGRSIETVPVVAVLIVAAVAGIVVALAGSRVAVVRSLLAVLALAAVVTPAVFLLAPSLRSLVRPGTGPGGTTTPVTVDSQAPAAGAPVIVVLLDELPLASLLDSDETINAARYPAFARLAGRSHWFRNATTVAHSTAYAVPAILSGRYPAGRLLPVHADYPHNLFTQLARAGYGMNVVEPHTDLCPASLCEEATVPVRDGAQRLASDLWVVYLHMIVPPAWRYRLPTIGESWSNFAPTEVPTETEKGEEAEDTTPKPTTPAAPRKPLKTQQKKDAERPFHDDPAHSFRHFVDTIEAAPQPTLHFLHVMLPHMPWRYLPDGRRYEPVSAPREPHGLVDQLWQGSPFEVLQAQQRHLLQVAFTDRLIGELMDTLDARDLFDSSLLVVVADHGTAFVPGRLRRNLLEPLIADITNVPLFIKMPGQTSGRIDDRNAETIDLLPTVMTAVGAPLAIPRDVPMDSPIDGRDLLGPPPASEAKQTFRSGLAGSSPGRPLPFDTTTLVRQRRALVAQTIAVFGRRPAAVMSLGKYGPLVGRRLTSLTVADTPSVLTMRIDQGDALAQVDPKANIIPARITGHLLGPDAQNALGGRPLAVVLRGFVQAVTESHRDMNGLGRFSAMIGARGLRPGRNDVTLYEIIGTPEEPVLAAVGAHAAGTFEPFAADFESGDLSEWPRVKGRMARRARPRNQPPP